MVRNMKKKSVEKLIFHVLQECVNVYGAKLLKMTFEKQHVIFFAIFFVHLPLDI